MPSSALFGAIAVLAAVTAPRIAHATEPRTLAAAEAVDKAWSVAETQGDTAFLEKMLAPEYRSVGATGKVTPKAAIVEHARKNQDPVAQAEAAREVEAWRAAHPYRTAATLIGDTAILTFISTTPDAPEVITSSDVFVYLGGAWHAVYSQHTSAVT